MCSLLMSARSCLARPPPLASRSPTTCHPSPYCSHMGRQLALPSGGLLIPASRVLHLLFPLSRTFFPQIFMWLTSSLYLGLYSKATFPDPSVPSYFQAPCHPDFSSQHKPMPEILLYVCLCNICVPVRVPPSPGQVFAGTVYHHHQPIAQKGLALTKGCWVWVCVLSKGRKGHLLRGLCICPDLPPLARGNRSLPPSGLPYLLCVCVSCLE